MTNERTEWKATQRNPNTRELVEQLQRMDEDADVLVRAENGEYLPIGNSDISVSEKGEVLIG